MHFNPENNYYITLGISKDASSDEIRDRWKRLMLLYHPDRQPGEGEWVSERAKKVNEAYSTLKDNSKRTAFDRKLNDQSFQQKSVYRHQPDLQAKKTPSPQRNSNRFSYAGTRWGELRKYLPKMLVGLYVFIALVFIGFIYHQNGSSSLETELSIQGNPQSPKVVNPSASTKAANPEAAANGSGLPIGRSEPARQVGRVPVGEKKIPDGGGQKAALSGNTDFDTLTAEKDQKSKDQARQAADEKRPLYVQAPSQSKDTAKAKEGMRSADAPAREDPRRAEPIYPAQLQVDQKSAKQAAAAEPKTVPDSRATRTSPQTTDRITQAEVEDFIRRYSEAFEKSDLNTFISFFSRSAIENNTMNYSAILSSYRKTFAEKINYYRLQSIEIRIEGQNAFVSGVYNINRYISSENRWVRYSGKIHWKLARENDALKIMTANYDN